MRAPLTSMHCGARRGWPGCNQYLRAALHPVHLRVVGGGECRGHCAGAAAVAHIYMMTTVQLSLGSRARPGSGPPGCTVPAGRGPGQCPQPDLTSIKIAPSARRANETLENRPSYRSPIGRVTASATRAAVWTPGQFMIKRSECDSEVSALARSAGPRTPGFHRTRRWPGLEAMGVPG